MKARQAGMTLAAVLSATQVGYGLAEERVGPDKDHQFKTHEQPFWPKGMVEIMRHDSRVYSIWVNGNESIYFKSSEDGIAELIKRYANTRIREHVLTIKKGSPTVKTFKKDTIGYNVHFHYMDGIALHMTRREGEPKTYDPTLTIYVDAGADRALLNEIVIPDHVVVTSEVRGWAAKSKASLPKRKLWHAEVRFDDGSPAADFENNLSTKVTLWEKGIDTPIRLGDVNHEGFFNAAFSEHELADLKAGDSWLTLTVGNTLVKPDKNHPRLKVESLVDDPKTVVAVEVGKPRFYHGRLLFDDGSPPVLDPKPWPGAEISISFPYAGRVTIDKEGYFKVYFTPEQLADMKARKVRKNIYIPNFEMKGRSTARYAYPAMDLSLDKEKAGEMRIAKPKPKPKPKKQEQEVEEDRWLGRRD